MGRVPVAGNIALNGHTFAVNPSKMDLEPVPARSLFTNLLGAPVAVDLVSGGQIITKRTWKFSGIDAGDWAYVLTAMKIPGAVAFTDIYGDSYTVFIDGSVPLAVEGRRSTYGDFSFTLREA